MKRCFDNPGIALATSTEWTQWDIGIERGKLTGDWELWVDDVTFYK